MAGTPYVPSSRLERVPPARASVAVAWAIDLVVAGVFFFAAAVCLVIVLIPWGLESGPGSIAARLHPWAAWTAAIVGLVAATLATSLGRGQRSPGRQLAEIKTSTMSGGTAPAWRRMLRAAVLPLLCLVVAPASWLLSVAVAVALLGTCLATSDRRGLADRIAGLRDYQTDLVPVGPQKSPDHDTGGAVA
jgi:uncharacterized RDD family membrane protein YckC